MTGIYISQQDTMNGCLPYAQPGFDEKEIEKIVKHIYSTHSDSHNKLPFTSLETKFKQQAQVEIKEE
jgi:hypothetical protein